MLGMESSLRLGGQLASPARWHSHSRSLVRFPAGTNFLVGKKIPLAVLAARLGPLGHGSGLGGFFRGRVKPCCFLLMKNGWGPFTPPAVFFFKTSNMITLWQPSRYNLFLHSALVLSRKTPRSVKSIRVGYTDQIMMSRFHGCCPADCLMACFG